MGKAGDWAPRRTEASRPASAKRPVMQDSTIQSARMQIEHSRTHDQPKLRMLFAGAKNDQHRPLPGGIPEHCLRPLAVPTLLGEWYFAPDHGVALHSRSKDHITRERKGQGPCGMSCWANRMLRGQEGWSQNSSPSGEPSLSPPSFACALPVPRVRAHGTSPPLFPSLTSPMGAPTVKPSGSSGSTRAFPGDGGGRASSAPIHRATRIVGWARGKPALSPVPRDFGSGQALPSCGRGARAEPQPTPTSVAPTSGVVSHWVCATPILLQFRALRGRPQRNFGRRPAPRMPPR